MAEPATYASRRDPLLDALRFHVEQMNAGTLGHGLDPYSSRPVEHPMATALYLRGFVELHSIDPTSGWLDLAGQMLRRLRKLAVHTPAGCGRAWGLRFRWKVYASHHPFAVTTAIAGLALLDLYEATTDSDALALAADAADWFLHELPWAGPEGAQGPWYSPKTDDVLPNVAALTASFLARFGAHTGDGRTTARAEGALRFVLQRQHASGLWMYGTEPRNDRDLSSGETVDAIHTAYVLDGLMGGSQWLPEIRTDVDEAIVRGVRVFARFFVLPDGRLRERIRTGTPRDPERPEQLGLLEPPTIVADPGESRLWGYGATLAMLARLPIDIAYPLGELVLSYVWRHYLCSPSGRFPYRSDDLRVYPRHEAHLFEGLASQLVARSKSVRHDRGS